MKKNNFWKRFWTMDVHNHEGFTLVELIIVIAILAILSSVAVVGYSAYIKKANQQADLTLAAEIENALTLAMYSGELTSGDYVVIYADGRVAAYGNPNAADGVGTTIYAAMAAAYGDGWENSLKLKWDGWTVGIAGDAAKMNAVNNSNFDPDNMDKLLDQVQGVVGDAAGYLSGNVQVSEEIAALLNQNGIDINAGDTLDETTSMAAANAYVYLVAGELGGINLTDEDSMGEDDAAFMMNWIDIDFTSTPVDTVSAAAAKYASILALATYVDAQAGTDYASQLNVSADPRDDADAVLAEIKNSTDSNVRNAYDAYYDDTNGLPVAYNDAVSFLTYMQGVTDSSDNLLQNTDLSSNQYFVDGYVSDYVNSYLAVSDILAVPGAEGSAMAFLVVGDDIICMFSNSEN